MTNRWRGLPYQILTGSMQDQAFATTNGYDLVGNPTAIAYGDHTSEALSFGYNELNQLTSLSGSASEGYGNYLQGTADIGNLLASRAGSYGYPGGHPAPPPRAQCGERRRLLPV